MRIRSALAIAAALLALGFCGPLSAREIYRWVDADGVVSFSSTPPAALVGIERIQIDEVAPDPGRPAADTFNIAATAERTRALREDMEERRAAQRAARLERERIAAQQTVIHRFEETPAYPWYGLRPPHPRPPGRPRPPIAKPEPFPVMPFAPPGGGQQ